jgi:hypothetical protein
MYAAIERIHQSNSAERMADRTMERSQAPGSLRDNLTEEKRIRPLAARQAMGRRIEGNGLESGFNQTRDENRELTVAAFPTRQEEDLPPASPGPCGEPVFEPQDLLGFGHRLFPVAWPCRPDMHEPARQQAGGTHGKQS